MSSFPSSEERTVASSLLLLNTSPPSPLLSTPKFPSDSSDAVPEREKATTARVPDKYRFPTVLINPHLPLSPMTAIARKIRSKVTWTSSCSGDRKPNAGEAANMLSPVSASGEASSCLSSSSSGISSARSLRYAKRCRGAIVERVTGIGRETAEPSSRPAGSPHLRRRGEAILKLLSCGDSSEVKIRQMLGDSPDTSKALRMLLRVDAVKRSGSGGRYDPYVYTVHIFIIH
ncbi:uncharacterized protein LOC124827184 [Vigna umbellata]|uniref:uncharacterized protein LOC124827184 n=1 Tax=Vigna umbellata TaxID=87088 RepID=UPI001F5FA51A|nr:uncharacterized protein LOC124827184 [Vigna umbellata]